MMAAGNCIVCKSSLESFENNLMSLRSSLNHNPSSNTNGFNSEPLFCHRRCFICSVCSASLGEGKFDSCDISIDNQLFCTAHCQNSEDLLLIRALKCFKARSLALKEALEDETAVNDFQEELTNFACTCNDPKYVHKVNGYRVECTEKDCLTRDSFTKSHENRFKSYCDFGSTRISGHTATVVPPEELYRQFFYGVKHWNYCTREEDIGIILITLKPETNPHSKGYFRIMIRSSYHLIFGLLSSSNHHHINLSSREDVVQFLSQQADIKTPMKLITAPSAPAELLKMDSAFNKQAYKFGVVYMKEDQQTEEELFGNESHSKSFDGFLDLLGQRVRLRGFDKYRAGLDGNNDLTGKYSVFTKFNNNEIMFHVSTLLPFEESDSQKLQRKRHIGNDIVCIIFMEATRTKFVPDCIKSNFLHSFIIVQVDMENNPDLYTVSVVSRDNVLPYEPPLYKRHVFEKNDEFRDWILRKLIHGEQACHRSPNFAKLHARTRTLIMGSLLKSAARNSHPTEDRKISPSSAFPGAFHEHHVTVTQVSRDFSSVGHAEPDREDLVAFLVGDADKKIFIGVKSIMSAKSKVFHKMFSQDLGHAYVHLPVSKNSSSPTTATPPTLQRRISWNRPSPMMHTGLRSGKVNLEKLRRSRSESDSTYDESVTLESVTDLEHKKEPDRSVGLPQLQCQEVIIVKQFDSDVFEALLEFLHVGSCDLSSSLLPGLHSAAQYYQVEALHEVCVESLKQRNVLQSSNDKAPRDVVSNNLVSPPLRTSLQPDCVTDTQC
ncbi:uncharacterized protein LOC144664014 isoform X2 [Oculina patagonica]